MFRIWKFNVASKAYWSHAPKIKYKQSNNNTFYEQYNQRENEEIVETFISTQNDHRSSGDHSNAKQDCKKKICFDCFNFCNDNLVLKVGTIGAIHYIINHWDSVKGDTFCPVQNFKIFTQYLVDHVVLSANKAIRLKTTLNVLPKESCSASNHQSLNAFNIEKCTSLVNNPDFFYAFESTKNCNEPCDKQRKSIKKLPSYDTESTELENHITDVSKTEDDEKIKTPVMDNGMANLSNILTNLMSCEIDNITAIELADQGRYSESINIWESILKRNPNFVKAIFNLAICYQEGHGVTKNLTKACNLYETAVFFGHIASHYNLAIILLKESSRVNDKDAKNRAVYLLTVAAQKGLSNASEALIHHSLNVDGNLQTLSNVPKNQDIQSENKENVRTEQSIPDLDDKNASLSNAYAPKMRYNSLFTARRRLKDVYNFNFFDEPSGVGDTDISRISNDVFTDDDDDDIVTFVRYGSEDDSDSHSGSNRSTESGDRTDRLCAPRNAFYDVAKTGVDASDGAARSALRTCVSADNIRPNRSDDSGNGSDDRVKGFYLLGDLARYSADLMLVKR